jgi:PPP family 3-phenylpropionic acid transporter
VIIRTVDIDPRIPLHSSFAFRLAVFYAALFVALGVQVPFLPLWLAAKGLNPGAIGVVLSLPMIVRMLAIPFATHAADRRDALHTVIVIASAVAILGYGVLGLAEGVVAITLAYALASAFFTPLLPLADAYALRGLGHIGRAYGPVRMWGSAAFIVGTFGAGLLLDVIATRDLIWIMVGSLAISAAAALALSPLTLRDDGSPGKLLPFARDLLRDPVLLAAAAAASLIQASHAVYYGFSALDWTRAGFDGGAIGALWALGVVAEIALFAVSGRLSIAPTMLIVLGGAGAVIRWGAMAFDPPPVLLPLLQCLHALSFGATHLGAVAVVARRAPAELAASAQGYFAVALGLVMAAAMGVSGVIYARWGNFAYGAMALAAAAGGIFAIAAHRLARGK